MDSRLKAALGVSICLVYGLIGLLIPIFIWTNTLKRKAQAKLISLTAKLLLRLLNIRVQIRGSFDQSERYLIIANHQTYVDILIISSLLPSIFVTSTDTKKSCVEWPLTALGGCILINRHDRSNLPAEVSEICRVMSRGVHVVIFPEGKTSDGQHLLRFRKPFFQSALNAKRNILPLCLNYLNIDGDLISLETRASVITHEPISTGAHILKLLKVKSVVAEVNILSPIKIETIKDAAEAAETVQTNIAAVFKPITNRHSSRQDKRA